MTEQEFRDALKRQIGQTGLSSDRQATVLARMKGGESKVRTSNKLKLALTLAALVVLTVSAAVATEVVKYVNWEGEPVDYEALNYISAELPKDPLRDPTAEKLISSKKLEEVLLIDYPAGIRIEAHKTEVASLEELRELAGEDILLPIPVSVPDGFTLEASHVVLLAKQSAIYHNLGEEKYKDVIRVRRYACDPDDLLLVQYLLYFRDAEGEHLNFSARLLNDTEYVLQANAEAYGTLQVSGMERSVYIDKGDRMQVYMQNSLPEPVDVQIVSAKYENFSFCFTDMERQYIAVELQSNSTVCDMDTMLSCFDLTAE